MEIELDGMLAGVQQMLDADAAGKIWLNNVKTVDGLLYEMQIVAWQARVNQAKGEITEDKRYYLISAKVSELVQIFEGRHQGYAALPWNEDSNQMKAHLIKNYWEGNEDAPGVDEVLPCTLDDCAASAWLGVEALLPSSPEFLRQELEQVHQEITECRLRAGACLMGMPVEVYRQMLD